MNFTWEGKSEILKIIEMKPIGILRPDKASSKNWDTTENLYIEGDNLEVLRLLQKSYFGKIKMIYIDPPYNTGKDFVYKDDFRDNIKNYKEMTQQTTKANTETNGRYHTDWLNMMYPRLKLARNLLREDGVIFISIDDHEMANLKKICDEIFGEDNYVRELTVINNLKGNNDEFAFAGTHEYLLVYAKDINKTEFKELNIDEDEMEDWEEDEYGYYKKGANLKSTGVNAPREKRPNLWFPLYISRNNDINIQRFNEDDIEIFPITNGQEMTWRWSKYKFLNEKHNIIIVRNNGDISLYKKQRPSLGNLPTKKPKSVFYKPEYSSGNGTGELKKLFRGKKIFDNPKPTFFIKDLLVIASDPNSLILDFFSGSATTAHAVMQLNAEDGGNRKFIMVQLPEPTAENSEAYKAGYKNICEIGKERIRRAGEKIVQETGKNDLDIGFKVFKFDYFNIDGF